MPIPKNIRDSAQKLDNDNRLMLSYFLNGVESDDELFLRCVRKASASLKRFNSADEIWLKKWMPLIFKKLENDHDGI
jgi:hypothetical protein